MEKQATQQSKEKLEKVNKTDAEWRQQLSDQEYQVTRKKGTEPAFTGKYWNTEKHGVFECVCCGEPLFDSATKFDSGQAGQASMRRWMIRGWNWRRTNPTAWCARK